MINIDYSSLVGSQNLPSTQFSTFNAEAAKAQFEADLNSDQYKSMEFFNKQFHQAGRGLHHVALETQFSEKYSVDITSVDEAMAAIIKLMGNTDVESKVFTEEAPSFPLSDSDNVAEVVLCHCIRGGFPVKFTPRHKLFKEGVELAKIHLAKGVVKFHVEMTPAIQEAMSKRHIKR
ncbi:MAG: hypothetical protein Q4D33_07655 [Prevotellaceae bacterium]|nr:hypothetical protein [Prevotellaceae bacterium]